MLCRAILTAIVISCTFSREIPVHARGQGSPRLVQIKDVICVLLLSGLQKEDLDANTLDKLRRHNVNIYDMNNESLRQECLLKSYLNTAKNDQNYENTEDTSVISVDKQSHNGGLKISDIQKSEIAAPENYFVDKSNIRNLVDEIKINGGSQREQTRNDNIRTSNVMENNQDQIRLIKVDESNGQQYDYLKNQPSLQSVMKFWDKLSRKSKLEAGLDTTARSAPQIRIVKKLDISTTTPSSENKGYVHSREMEYISRIMAEYLASQTVATTTQMVTRSTQKEDFISKRIKELLTKKSKNQEIDLSSVWKNIGNAFDKTERAIGDQSGVVSPIKTIDKDETATENYQHMHQKLINYNNNEQPERLQGVPYNAMANLSPKAVDKKSAQKMRVVQYLNDILRLNSEFNNNAPASYTERSTQYAIIDNEEQQTSRKFITIDPNNNKDSDHVEDTQTANEEVKGVSASVIEAIAQKVKEIVMKDIRNKIPIAETSTFVMTPKTITSSTTTSATEATTSHKEIKENHQVIQTLMELFKQLKANKDKTRATVSVPFESSLRNENSTFRTPSLDRMFPPVMAGINPYGLMTPNLKQINVNTYKQKVVPIVPLKQLNRAQDVPSVPLNKNYEPRAPAITIQSNAGEIPPLAIHLSNAMKPLNQHIIVTTQNPFEKHREEWLQRESNKRVNDKLLETFNVGKERNHQAEEPTYAELTKKLRAAENAKNEYRDSYKDRIDRLKERIKYARDHTRHKSPLGSDYRVDLNRHSEPNHHDVLTLSHHDSKGHETLRRPQDSSHYEVISRPLEPDNQDTLSRPMDSNNHDVLSRPHDSDKYQTISRPLESDPHESRQGDSSHRDIITREVLSRLVGSNHHDVISRLVESSPYISRPVDLKSHLSDTYDRIDHEHTQPRYKPKKYHEELERVENRGHSHNGNSKGTSTNCCDPVAARQQMPLAKLKQHSKFDDTHFRNFLKSQQKVTDMLERILATKTKDEPHSVETS